jgi:hypothetical protein
MTSLGEHIHRWKADYRSDERSSAVWMRKDARLFSPFARTSAKAVLNEERTLSDAMSRTSGAAESKLLCTGSERCFEPRKRQTDTRGLEKLVWPAWLH